MQDSHTASTAYQCYQLPLGNGMQSAMHRFGAQPNADPLLLIHGSIEDSRIFHSRSGKGIAPYLAAHGYDVFAPDLAGKGNSEPPIRRGFSHSQFDFISRDLPLYLDHVQQLHPGKKVRLGAHSWGGVLLLAWMARYAQLEQLGPSVFFASKRRISVLSLRRILMVDIMWTLVGEAATIAAGYLPAKAIGLGSCDEPAAFYRQVNKWVYSKGWKGEDGYDYAAALRTLALPPVLYLAGIDDRVLGHPTDVQRLMNESGQKNVHCEILGVTNGNRNNYGHIDILTHRDGPVDHFPMALKWFRSATLP